MKQKKAIISLLSILTFATVLTAYRATGLTPHLANSDVVQDVLPSGEGSNLLEFWEINEYENWMKTEREKNQKLADSGDVSFYCKDANENYVCRAWIQGDVDLLYAEWQEQLSLMKQGYHFTKAITFLKFMSTYANKEQLSSLY